MNDTEWLPSLDSQSSIPLYEQILEAVAIALAAGDLKPGDRLPSVRTLAKELRMNPNTTARAFRKLEREGLVEAVRGIGTVVSEGAPDRAGSLAESAFRRELAGVVRVARQLGMSRTALRDALERLWEDNPDAH